MTMTGRERLTKLVEEIFGGAIIGTEDDIKHIREGFIKVVDHLIANDVVRPKGEWGYTGVEDEDWGATWHKWTCSNCGYSTGQNPFGANFCPNCGADMRKETK